MNHDDTTQTRSAVALTEPIPNIAYAFWRGGKWGFLLALAYTSVVSLFGIMAGGVFGFLFVFLYGCVISLLPCFLLGGISGVFLLWLVKHVCRGKGKTSTFALGVGFGCLVSGVILNRFFPFLPDQHAPDAWIGMTFIYLPLVIYTVTCGIGARYVYDGLPAEER